MYCHLLEKEKWHKMPEKPSFTILLYFFLPTWGVTLETTFTIYMPLIMSVYRLAKENTPHAISHPQLHNLSFMIPDWSCLCRKMA